MRGCQRASSSCHHRCHGRRGRSPRATARQSPWSGGCPATRTSRDRSASKARTPPTIGGGSLAQPSAASGTARKAAARAPCRAH
eukprot:scaffold59361_cov98-Phaeocystis_antarctica.AAC.1